MPPGEFVKEYLIALNATQAAIRAGYSAFAPHDEVPAALGFRRVGPALEKGRNEGH